MATAALVSTIIGGVASVVGIIQGQSAQDEMKAASDRQYAAQQKATEEQKKLQAMQEANRKREIIRETRIKSALATTAAIGQGAAGSSSAITGPSGIISQGAYGIGYLNTTNQIVGNITDLGASAAQAANQYNAAAANYQSAQNLTGFGMTLVGNADKIGVGLTNAQSKIKSWLQ